MASQQFTHGVGINFRREIELEIVRNLDKFDLVEVISDTLFAETDLSEILRHILQTKPIVMHGLRMSIGGAECLDYEYMAKTLDAVRRWGPLWFSDHIAYSKVGRLDIGQLMPVRRTAANLHRIVDKIQHICAAIDIPFLVENITYYFDMGGEEISESALIGHILQRTNCGLLLDLNNLYINACNHKFDPYKSLEDLDLRRVVEIHIAGGFTRDHMLVDSHGHAVGEPVWRLLEFVCAQTRPQAIILERDANFDICEMLESVARAREILQSALMIEVSPESACDVSA